MLTHVNQAGKAIMVNVQKKIPSVRTAVAQCIIKVPDDVYKAVLDNTVKKGDVLTVSRIAGIMGAKKTAELIPLCHQINLDVVEVDIDKGTKNQFIVSSKVVTEHKTGVEMEALNAVSITALTVYDMCKGISKEITIDDLKLTYKTGGKTQYDDYDI